jgi:hypothetical protein
MFAKARTIPRGARRKNSSVVEIQVRGAEHERTVAAGPEVWEGRLVLVDKRIDHV